MHRNAVFEAEGAHLAYNPGALSHEAVPYSMQCLNIDLIRRTHLDKPHCWPCHGPGYSFGINDVTFVGFDEGLHKLCSNNSNCVAKALKLPRQPL